MDTDRFRTVLRELRAGKLARAGKPRLSAEALSALTETGDPTLPRIHPMTIHKIEEGKTKDPGFITIARLVEAMGLTLQDFCRCLALPDGAGAISPLPEEVVAHEAPATPPPVPYTLEDFKVVAEHFSRFLMDAIERSAANAAASQRSASADRAKARRRKTHDRDVPRRTRR